MAITPNLVGNNAPISISNYHAHGFTASQDAGSHFACLVTVNDDGKAKLYPRKAVLQGTNEDELAFVATVEITPGDPTSSCPSLVGGSALDADPLDVATASLAVNSFFFFCLSLINSP